MARLFQKCISSLESVIAKTIFNTLQCYLHQEIRQFLFFLTQHIKVFSASYKELWTKQQEMQVLMQSFLLNRCYLKVTVQVYSNFNEGFGKVTSSSRNKSEVPFLQLLCVPRLDSEQSRDSYFLFILYAQRLAQCLAPSS